MVGEWRAANKNCHSYRELDLSSVAIFAKHLEYALIQIAVSFHLFWGELLNSLASFFRLLEFLVMFHFFNSSFQNHPMTFSPVKHYVAL